MVQELDLSSSAYNQFRDRHIYSVYTQADPRLRILAVSASS
jgi:hypothetical protein